MELIGYTCPYTPVEILSATGLQPYCLLHGDSTLAQDGEQYVRVDACSFVKSNVSAVLSNQRTFRAFVGTTACDMARRMFDVLGALTKIPVFLFHNPRTDNPNIYSDEIDWLVKELEHLTHEELKEEVLKTEIEKWENVRQQFRAFDKKRYARPSLVSTTDMHTAAMSYYKGDIGAPARVREAPSDKPRVYLVGSEITYESQTFLSRLEQDLAIVGDFNCGLSRFLNISIPEKNLNGIKQAYYNQPPSIYKRPNSGFYEHIKKELKNRACEGIIVYILDYCDSYEFEVRNMEQEFGLPLLKIKSDLSVQNISQVQTRISAFRELLEGLR